MARAIDANELYRIEKLLDTDIVRQDKVALNLLEQVLYDIQHVPTLTQPNEPLTLEELREMDEEPVWVEDVKHWALIDIEKGGQWDGVPFAVWAENGVKFTYNVESRDLHCYRRPPEGEEEEKHVIEITENL